MVKSPMNGAKNLQHTPDWKNSGRYVMEHNLINIAVTFYKGKQQMTKEELEQLKKSNPSKEELDRINVKLKQINC